MIRKYLPTYLDKELFGYRDIFKNPPPGNDPDWQKWISLYPSVYRDTQRSTSIQQRVNNAGYKILETISLKDKNVAEIGPGGGHHIEYFQGRPKSYNALDVCQDFAVDVSSKCEKHNIPFNFHIVEAYKAHIPLPDASQDVFLSFYSMEHLYPLADWIAEIRRVLKPGGEIVGAIPAEGGLLWGLGRFLTSRRILKNKYNLDIRKIVCWEHPNMCDDIINEFSKISSQVYIEKWPLNFMPYDLTACIKFRVVV
jgi:SAM-dependent methyltransferase